MIAYHCDSNAMLIAPFNSCKDSHQLLAYNEITTQLKKHTLIGIGRICDADGKIVFTKQAVVVYDQQQQPIITGWQEHTGAKL